MISHERSRVVKDGLCVGVLKLRAARRAKVLGMYCTYLAKDNCHTTRCWTPIWRDSSICVAMQSHIPSVLDHMVDQISLYKLTCYVSKAPTWLGQLELSASKALLSAVLICYHSYADTCHGGAFCVKITPEAACICFCSFISRPSHRPVFDHLQYAKTEGKGLVYFITWMMSVSTYLGRQREGGIAHHKNEFEALSCSFCPKR